MKYEVTNTIEFASDINGEHYLIIYGHHINGYFCAVVSHGWSCEMSNSSDTNYNFERLYAICKNKEVAKAIVSVIQENKKD